MAQRTKPHGERLATATLAAIENLAEFSRMREEVGMAVIAERPAGGITAPEYAKVYKCAPSTAKKELRRLRDAGKVKEVMFRGFRNMVTCIYVPVRQGNK